MKNISEIQKKYLWGSSRTSSYCSTVRVSIERVKALSRVDWYVSVDMKNRYRQVPVHPEDWFSQIYSLGENEHYIDLCMPFGKSNSSKIFYF